VRRIMHMARARDVPRQPRSRRRAVYRLHDLALAPYELRPFEDGEHKCRPQVPVRAADAYVVASLYDDASESVNDRLCRALFFLGALRDSSARRVTLVAPYLCYARKDRRTNPRDPVTTRYVARVIDAVAWLVPRRYRSS